MSDINASSSVIVNVQGNLIEFNRSISTAEMFKEPCFFSKLQVLAGKPKQKESEN